MLMVHALGKILHAGDCRKFDSPRMNTCHGQASLPPARRRPDRRDRRPPARRRARRAGSTASTAPAARRTSDLRRPAATASPTAGCATAKAAASATAASSRPRTRCTAFPSMWSTCTTCAGPHHVHPNGEIDLIMPLEGDATFDGRPAGWCVYAPGSAHCPTVAQGRALVLYLLPEGAIQFTGNDRTSAQLRRRSLAGRQRRRHGAARSGARHRAGAASSDRARPGRRPSASRARAVAPRCAPSPTASARAMLAEIVKMLQANRDAYYEIATANSGTVKNDSAIDIDGGIYTLGQYAAGATALGDARALPKATRRKLGKDAAFQSQHVLVPTRGVALFINAFNFPAWGLWEKAAPGAAVRRAGDRQARHRDGMAHAAHGARRDRGRHRCRPAPCRSSAAARPGCWTSSSLSTSSPSPARPRPPRMIRSHPADRAALGAREHRGGQPEQRPAAAGRGAGLATPSSCWCARSCAR